MSDSNAASSSQTLLDALIELRRLGPAGVFSDSGRFRAFMLDLRPGLKKEVRVLSALIDAGYLQRLQDAAESEREIVSAQIKLWLDEELDLKSETAHNYSSVLLAFFSGAVSMAAAGFSPAQFDAGAGVQSESIPLTGPSSQPLGFSVSSADECIVKGARLYAKGQYREAADWYRRAAEQGDADAQYMLGNMYRDGVGVESNLDLAVDWYCRAVAQGHAEAKQALFSRAAALPKPAAPKSAVPPKTAVQSITASTSLRDVYANKRVGDRFEFGSYPQGKHGAVRPITWRVLRRDSNGLLVIAEKGLDCKPYHEVFTDITWADCSLRRWLNADFYNRAFSERERALILPARIANNSGPETEDRVFLLGVDEAEQLFADDDDRMALPTEYAVKNGVHADYECKIDGVGCCWWWLRSRGSSCDDAANVGSDGGVDAPGLSVNLGLSAVRPACIIYC